MSTAEGETLPGSIGFVGLGAMGKPMVTNLAKALAQGSHIHVYDVVSAPMDELSESFPETIVKCGSPKEVTEKSVSLSATIHPVVHMASFD